MKVFFVASLHGKEKYNKTYEQIIGVLEEAGYVVVKDHVVNYSKEYLAKLSPNERDKFHREIIKKMKASDVVVAEISYPSISVGYLVSKALDFGRPTIVLHAGNSVPHILDTLEEVNRDKLQVISYDLNSGIPGKVLIDAVKEAEESMDTRFNFFISPEIGAYLDWIAKNKRIPRAVYLRRLIEEDMRNNKEYNGEV